MESPDALDGSPSGRADDQAPERIRPLMSRTNSIGWRRLSGCWTAVLAERWADGAGGAGAGGRDFVSDQLRRVHGVILLEHLVRDYRLKWGRTWTKAFLQSQGLLERAERRSDGAALGKGPRGLTRKWPLATPLRERTNRERAATSCSRIRTAIDQWAAFWTDRGQPDSVPLPQTGFIRTLKHRGDISWHGRVRSSARSASGWKSTATLPARCRRARLLLDECMTERPGL